MKKTEIKNFNKKFDEINEVLGNYKQKCKSSFSLSLSLTLLCVYFFNKTLSMNVLYRNECKIYSKSCRSVFLSNTISIYSPSHSPALTSSQRYIFSFFFIIIFILLLFFLFAFPYTLN